MLPRVVGDKTAAEGSYEYEDPDWWTGCVQNLDDGDMGLVVHHNLSDIRRGKEARLAHA